MEQKTIEIDLVDGKIVISDVDQSVFSVDCEEPKLKLRQIYDAVFANMDRPTEIKVLSTSQVDADEKSRRIYNSIKKIIDGASRDINEKLPDVIKQREMIEQKLLEDMDVSVDAPGGDGE